jgi:hypothetical protein
MNHEFDVMTRKQGNGWDLLVHVYGFESKEAAESFGEAIAEWMTNDGNGEFYRYQ